jgi:hypothetical protein
MVHLYQQHAKTHTARLLPSAVFGVETFPATACIHFVTKIMPEYFQTQRSRRAQRFHPADCGFAAHRATNCRSPSFLSSLRVGIAAESRHKNTVPLHRFAVRFGHRSRRANAAAFANPSWFFSVGKL